MKYTYPGEASGAASLVSIDAELVPIVAGSLRRLLNPFLWETGADYRRGYNAIAALLAQMPNNYLERLTVAAEFTARLLNTSLNGVEYTEDAGVVTPALPLVPPVSTNAANAMRAHLGALLNLSTNAATGAAYPAGAGVSTAPELPASLSWAARLLGVQGVRDTGWFSPDEPVTLKDLLEAGRVNSEDDRLKIRNATQSVTDTVEAGGSVVDAIGDYLQVAADAGTDGGVIAIQLATSAAILLQLQRINVALNGNPAISLPTDGNILFALRGDSTITTANNVLSLLALQRTAQDLTAARLYDGGTRLTNAELLALVANRTQQTAGNTATAADRLLAIQRLISQDSPLAEGNDLYNVLIAINDNARRSADCCEGEAGDGTLPPPESTGDCAGWGEYIRAVNYVFVADVDDGAGGDLQTLYDVEFDFSGQPWFQSAGTSGGRVFYEIAGTDDLELEFCWAHSFGAAPVIRAAGPDFAASIADATNTGYSVPPDLGQTGEVHLVLDIGDTAGEVRYFGFTAQFPRGVIPPKNIFVKARYTVV